MRSASTISSKFVVSPIFFRIHCSCAVGLVEGFPLEGIGGFTCGFTIGGGAGRLGMGGIGGIGGGAGRLGGGRGGGGGGPMGLETLSILSVSISVGTAGLPRIILSGSYIAAIGCPSIFPAMSLDPAIP